MDEAAVGAGNVRRTVAITLIVVAIAGVGVALILWRDIILLLFAGIVVATALQPAVDLLTNRLKLRPVVSAIVLYSALCLLFVGLAIWLAPQLWNQGLQLWEQLPNWYGDAREWMVSSSRRTLHRIGEWMPEEFPEFTFAALDTPTGEPGATAGGGTLGLLRTALMTVLGLLTVGFLAFYWTANRDVTLRTLLGLVPEHRREFYSDLSDTLFMKLGAYVRGQLILCAIVGVFSLIAYYFIGLPYVLVLALVAGLLEAIPVFGPTLGAVPALLVGLSMGPQTALWVLIAAMVIQTLENYLFVPKIMDRSVGISAVVTLLSLVAFGALFGLLGAILAIPLAAIVQTLFDKLVLQADFKEKDVAISRDFDGVMRYQLLDLIHDVQRQQRLKSSDVEETTTNAFNEIEALATALDDLIVHEEPGSAVSPQGLLPARSA
jgi:predicted PurR-regulated permease PerM